MLGIIILLLTSSSTAGDDNSSKLWTDSGVQWSDQLGWIVPPQSNVTQSKLPSANIPMISLGNVGPTQVETRSNTYGHTVRVYESGHIICEGSTGDKPKETPSAAAETAMWLAKECLREKYYSRGMGHEAVSLKVSKVLSKESCKLETSRDDQVSWFDYKATMTCIVP